MKSFVLPLLMAASLPVFSQKSKPPQPFGVIPKPYQLQVLEMERYAIMHFTPTTYENKEWGYGDADPKIFNPAKFNATQIVNALKNGGFKGITVVAKHHDGFCLWPTATTDYNISKSPFRNGRGDLVMEMKTALSRAGMKLGLYCSPWDRNNAYYADKKYVTDVYYNQLKELYTKYGPLFTVFFDGANGGDGYYGGTREKRQINAAAYYDYDKIFSMVRELQPTANIFSDIGPDLRWVGNERGIAPETSWATFTPIGINGNPPAPGSAVDDRNLGSGTRYGNQWTPAECDVPLRPGWFHHPEQEDKVKTPAKLMEIYYSSVGRGGTMDLGISPTTEGIMAAGDVEKLRKFNELIRKTFAKNLAANAVITASNTRGNWAGFVTRHLVDNDRYSYWATDDAVTTPTIEFSFPAPVRFNVIRLRENIKLGQRIERVAFDIWRNNQWEQLAEATSIGANRLIRLPRYINTAKMRVRVIKSPVCVAISDFGLFAEPEELVTPAAAILETIPLANVLWNSPGFEKAIDNNESTFARFTSHSQRSFDIDMSTTQTIRSIAYLPRQDGIKEGMITKYSISYNTDGKRNTWKVAARGEFSNIANNPILQIIQLNRPIQARYLRITAEETVDGKPATVSEIKLY